MLVAEGLDIDHEAGLVEGWGRFHIYLVVNGLTDKSFKEVCHALEASLLTVSGHLVAVADLSREGHWVLETRHEGGAGTDADEVAKGHLEFKAESCGTGNEGEVKMRLRVTIAYLVAWQSGATGRCGLCGLSGLSAGGGKTAKEENEGEKSVHR